MPEALFESELFGHVKGAFTGATTEKIGLIESANGGTLFLDEIGDIPLSDQVKLLRLLETRCFRRVGSTETRHANFRLVCATNKDLAAMIDAGTFRSDLYYRINVFDILHAATCASAARTSSRWQRASFVSCGRAATSKIADEALALLRGYAFPGNVRELKNTLERALAHVRWRRNTSPAPAARGAGAAGRNRLQPTLGSGAAVWMRSRSGYSERRSWPPTKATVKVLAKALGVSERALYRKISNLRAKKV